MRQILFFFVLATVGCKSAEQFSYRPGEQVDLSSKIGVEVHYGKWRSSVDGDGKTPPKVERGQRIDERTFKEFLPQDAKVICLIFVGGAHGNNDARNGGIWCKDTYEELGLIHKLTEKYLYKQPVRFFLVTCPPVYSDGGYGDARAKFLDAAENSPEYKEAVKLFFDRTREVYKKQEKFTSDIIAYDTRFRLLLNRNKPLPNQKVTESWEGRFKWQKDSQTYGTPCIWLLSKDGVVLREPFWGNNYPERIRYHFEDVSDAIDEALRKP